LPSSSRRRETPRHMASRGKAGGGLELGPGAWFFSHPADQDVDQGDVEQRYDHCLDQLPSREVAMVARGGVVATLGLAVETHFLAESDHRT